MSNAFSARLEQLKAKQNVKWLSKITTMLDEAGVPEWVENTDSCGVPSNAPHCRLKWFLARRKSVKLSETDQRLQREMEQSMAHARRTKRQTRKRLNGGVECDAPCGPCACGGWH